MKHESMATIAAELLEIPAPKKSRERLQKLSDRIMDLIPEANRHEAEKIKKMALNYSLATYQ
jgi:hypothetical protein